MKKFVKALGVMILTFVVAITALETTMVTAQAECKLSATSVKVKVGATKTIKIKDKYVDKYYISNVEYSSGSGDALKSTFYYSDDYTSAKFTGNSNGTVKLKFTVTNKSTSKSVSYTVKFTVSGSSKVKADFEVVDVNGNVKNISEYFGKPMLVNFWADWCGPCMGEMPEMYSSYKKYKKKVQFMFVNTDSNSASSSKATLKRAAGGNMPTFIDNNGSAYYALGINAIPRTILIDKNGYIVRDRVGAYASGSEINKEIKKYLLK